MSLTTNFQYSSLIDLQRLVGRKMSVFTGEMFDLEDVRITKSVFTFKVISVRIVNNTVIIQFNKNEEGRSFYYFYPECKLFVEGYIETGPTMEYVAVIKSIK